MWDPAKYLDYADLRGRPFFDLVARVGAVSPRRVVDLGCGPGNLTVSLRSRWPSAVLEAVDSSPEMVAAARQAGIAAEVLDVQDWKPAPDTDVVVTNAVLQWVPEHVRLLRRWVGELPPGAWLAMQVPGNFDSPSHVLARDLAGQWGVTLRGLETVATPSEYATLFADAGCQVDAWETTYVQRLTGQDAVLEWITGTALRPVRAALSDGEWAEFRSALAPRLREAYPARGDGTVWFPFRRVFAVAQV
ncbi:trans-aconitate 2-methyltransferase [Amycolatopsis bartoniae]|uniref:Trans-aconitate 2-methyltransferase n=1 Tax=Amycolatopsis bartoniae TaxID=941986 RepID=A0A8H9IW27_9PSEU|nr:trans-aconitate 2-methyltransferase [Amycolatopsis bartoniae]MBB2935684.1 trans-aconitate 2-methyltransferase [Amycolatopsis bartoniae]TVT02307.1 trans-aconitate 2-methyltransferase [Amycolatopsis bartoniae]GHF61107.1 trans-aconitate 2-methyltransferase [Amycolatopsis bartoniae]